MDKSLKTITHLYHPWKVSVLFLGLLIFSGCVSIPSATVLIARTGQALQPEGQCAAVDFPPSSQPSRVGLDSGGFGLLSWNLHRGSETGLEVVLRELASGQDLLAMQEARLDGDLHQVLDSLRLSWDFTPGFNLNGSPVGVLSAARTDALARCARRTTEPWLRIPKVALYTLYPLTGSRERLMLVNLHGINFSVGTTEFETQLAEAEAVVDGHKGPLIVAGDFNTWSAKRNRLLTDLTGRLGLMPVRFAAEHRVRVWDYPLDHIFYRGLRVLSASSMQQDRSDHNPLLVRFAVGDTARGAL